jgi:hypothetical protein
VISRRQTISLTLAVGSAAVASPANACRFLRPESRTPARKQIADVAGQIASGQSTGDIVASEDVRNQISQFISDVVSRRDQLGAKNVESVISMIYGNSLNEVYLVNFRILNTDHIILGCGDRLENNHAILSFREGALTDFHPMPVFNFDQEVKLRG